jgi:uncharacterized damage-inducible protein DinB
MITPGYVRTMAAYNSELNRRTFAAADTLPDAQRRENAGAFFRSLHDTLSHILWADGMWMHRFDGWEKLDVAIADSGAWVSDWAELRERRTAADARLEAWAARVTEADLEGDLVWFSGAAGREMARPRWLTITHMFNHQTHHRGQAHALLTRFGAKTAATDLPFVLPPESYARPPTSAE